MLLHITSVGSLLSFVSETPGAVMETLELYGGVKSNDLVKYDYRVPILCTTLRSCTFILLFGGNTAICRFKGCLDRVARVTHIGKGRPSRLWSYGIMFDIDQDNLHC